MIHHKVKEKKKGETNKDIEDMAAEMRKKKNEKHDRKRRQ